MSLPPSTQPPIQPPAGPSALHILLVEDNVLSAEYGELLLSRWGHRVSVAHDGIEALALHAGQYFGLILMDLEMPRLGGIACAAAIRAREQAQAQAQGLGAPAPAIIVALTAHADEAERQACLAAGMDGFLGKPLDIDTIGALLARFTAAGALPAGPG